MLMQEGGNDTVPARQGALTPWGDRQGHHPSLRFLLGYGADLASQPELPMGAELVEDGDTPHFLATLFFQLRLPTSWVTFPLQARLQTSPQCTSPHEVPSTRH